MRWTAGILSWGFAIPQATVTLVVAGPVDHAVNGGSLSWGFYLPRARVAHSGIAEYTLEVDWENDGTYANANADIWGRVIEGTFRCRRGRNFASQRSGRSVAGSLEVQLDNRDGLLDPDNTLGALNGLLSGGRRVRWRMNDGAGALETQWTGWLRTIEQIDRGSGLDRVRLRALGVISRLNPPRIGQQQLPVVVPQQINLTTQAAARLIFDPDGSIGSADAVVDGVDYRASYINGSRSMARWWASRPRLVELRDLEQTETGFLWEPKDGFVGMQGTAHRQQASAQVSQATFVDTNPAAGEIPAIRDGIKPDHPYEDLANIITSLVRTYGVGAEEVLWSVAGFPIAGNSDFSIVIRYPHEDAGSDRVAVSSWTALTEGTDYDAQPGVTLTLTTDGNNATIRIQNVSVATTMGIQLRGIPVVRNSAVEIITQDQDSIDEVGQPIPYPFETPWISNTATVAVIHGILLRLYSQPAERLTLTWEIESGRAKAASLDVSERVEVMRRGEATEFFIESIRHRVTPDWHFRHHDALPCGAVRLAVRHGRESVWSGGTITMTTIRQAHFYGGGAIWRASNLNDGANLPINDLAGKNGKRDREASLEVVSRAGRRTVTCVCLIGTTAQRPGGPRAGYLRFNTTIGAPEFWSGTTWRALDVAAAVVNFANLNANGGVGTNADQVSFGNHTH